MKKVIWLSTANASLEQVNTLNNYLLGEVVKFGDSSYMIIGGESVEKRYEYLQSQKAKKEPA
jgi:hypothetical protein